MGFCDAGYGCANSADDTGALYLLRQTTYISVADGRMLKISPTVNQQIFGLRLEDSERAFQ